MRNFPFNFYTKSEVIVCSMVYILSYVYIIIYFRTELVWKVGRCTTAAPVYITEMDNYVDGGVLANNPAVTGIARIQVYTSN